MTASWPLLEHIDARWPSVRPQGALHRDWSWRAWIRDTQCDERYVLVDARQSPRFIWCSTSRLLRLPGGPFYRVGRLEVDPTRVARGLGAFGMSVIMSRAIELQANGVVLKATADAAPFYRHLGAEPGAIVGWSGSPDLVQFMFASETMKQLAEVADEHRQEEDSARIDG